ncbi:MAG: zf-TFIIB domain-containing protein [Bacteroidetes bacterium]|nr:zf-TFIIB domain-containing protein [Bacteroidota bacterium]MCL5738325.1 zf-TFIIB domain-containing protein [Bacteroidota bacterium]
MFEPISNNGKEFPRELTPLEHELVFRQLPENSKTYRQYRERIERMKVVGLGRRGAGHLVLAEHEVSSDTLQLVTPVFAFGGAEQSQSKLTIVIHEVGDDAISIELMALKGNLESLDTGTARLWSVSDWKTGEKCPKCSTQVREIRLPLKDEREATLTVCAKHRGVWIHDSELEMNHIIPLTGFINELNKQEGLRKGKFEYHSPSQVFSELDEFSDTEFTNAFVLYNKFWRKLEVGELELVPAKKPSLASRLVSKFRGRN